MFPANSVPLIDLIVKNVMALNIVDKHMTHIDAFCLTAQQDVVFAFRVAQLEEQFGLTGIAADNLVQIGHDLVIEPIGHHRDGDTVKGFLLAAVVAIPLGLFIGWSARVGGAATYITKFFSSIPPIVYIPYGIALLPTFKSVSVFVIFLATFWPVFAGTMSGVLGVDKKIIDSAKVLNVSKPEMLFRVILPASLQQIFLGCNQGLSVSFILLTSAEMIGARDGMGYYVKYYSDFGDYTRTITGLLVIGFVVIGVTFLFNKLQNRLLRWKR